MQKRKCLLCNEEFLPKSFNQYICTNEHTFICPCCNKEYTPSKDQIRIFVKTQKIGGCSYKCRSSIGLQTKIEKYGKGNNGDKIKETYKNMSIENKQNIVSKIKQTKLGRYEDSNYNNTDKAKQTKLERYNNENYNNREKSYQTRLERYDDKNYTNSEKMIQTKLEKYGKGNNGDKISKSLKERYLTLVGLADILDVSPTCVADYYYKYNCQDKYPLKQPSYIEDDIEHLLNTYNIKYVKHSRNIIAPKELDIYIPDCRVAIECNGTYWHSHNKITDKNYHYNKSCACEEKGIRLIHVWEYEWNNERQRPILENIIKNALGINEKKIFARKCKIKVINETSELKEFFNRNNIQGFRGGKFAICLEYNNQIIMSYIFGHPFFGKGKYECEVIRGATELGYTIIGGASKIWKYFINNYKYNNCVYYIDYNYFNGNSLPYLDLKFIKTQVSFKNYFVKENKIKNRDPNHHKEILELYKTNEVWQIWNAGTKVYIWSRK